MLNVNKNRMQLFTIDHKNTTDVFISWCSKCFFYWWKVWTAGRPVQHLDTSTIKLCCNRCNMQVTIVLLKYAKGLPRKKEWSSGLKACVALKPANSFQTCWWFSRCSTCQFHRHWHPPPPPLPSGKGVVVCFRLSANAWALITRPLLFSLEDMASMV